MKHLKDDYVGKRIPSHQVKTQIKVIFIANTIFCITGMVFLVAVYILTIPGLGTKSLGETLEWIFLILVPNFDLGTALMDIFTNAGYKEACDKVIPLCTVLTPSMTFGCCPGKWPMC